MAVKLRLTRIGKKKQPFYRIVAADSRARRDGKYIEKIGHYNPLTHPAEIVINEEKVFYWLKNGAIPTETVKNLFSKKGIMLKWHLMKTSHDETKIEEEYKKWELLQLERQKRQEALAAQAKREHEQIDSSEESIPEAKDESVPEIKEETVPEVKEESVPEVKEESVPEVTEESVSETKEKSVKSQSGDQAPDQEIEESHSEDQISDTKDTDVPDESSDK